MAENNLLSLIEDIQTWDKLEQRIFTNIVTVLEGIDNETNNTYKNEDSINRIF